MKFATTAATRGIEILANDHYVGVPYCFEADQKAGDVIDIPEKLIAGVCLHDVNVAENPNGTLLVHGFINASKLTEEQTLNFVAANGHMPMIHIVAGSQGK